MPRPTSRRWCRCAGWSGCGPRWPWTSLALARLLVHLMGRLVGDCVGHLDLFLGHRAVDDPVGPELHWSLTIPVRACADEHIVRPGFAGQTDIGAAGVGLRRGV